MMSVAKFMFFRFLCRANLLRRVGRTANPSEISEQTCRPTRCEILKRPISFESLTTYIYVVSQR